MGLKWDTLISSTESGIESPKGDFGATPLILAEGFFAEGDGQARGRAKWVGAC